MKSTVLNGGQYLSPGYWIKSPNGQFTLMYQTDGNFVLYGPGRQALWNSGTWGRSAGKAIMQTDGNLVVYDASGRAVWNSGTWGNPGARLALQDDGNLVVYAPNGRALWNSGTWGGRSTIQQPSNPPASTSGGGIAGVPDLSGTWRPKRYGNNGTITITKTPNGYTAVGVDKIPKYITREGNTLWLRWSANGRNYAVHCGIEDVKSNHLNWAFPPPDRTSYDQWTR